MGFYAPRVPSWNRLQEMTVQAHLLQMGEKKKKKQRFSEGIPRRKLGSFISFPGGNFILSLAFIYENLRSLGGLS